MQKKVCIRICRGSIVMFAVTVIVYFVIYSKVNNENIFLVNGFFKSTLYKKKGQLPYSLEHTQNIKNVSKIVVVLGTRPEAVKCAPLIAELKSDQYASKFDVVVLSTGQHRQILKQTLNAFRQDVDIDLNLMDHDQKISDVFVKVFSDVTKYINILKPQLIVVQGDTTTALAAALAAAYQRVPVAHVEAGLRSFNLSNPYPEELNRKLIDSFAKLLFPPTTFAKEALLREGVCTADVFVTGNTGVDAFYAYFKNSTTSLNSSVLETVHRFKAKQTNTTKRTVILVTMHRRENYDHFMDMCQAVKTIAEMYGENVLLVFPIHPNPNIRKIVLYKLTRLENVKIVNPIPYDEFKHIISWSDIVMTDSGGIQEEAASIGKNVILMRLTTERPEGVYLGKIKQVGVNHDEIVNAVKHTIAHLYSSEKEKKLYIFGNGTASKQIAAVIHNYLNSIKTTSLVCTTKVRQDSIAKSVYSSVAMKQTTDSDTDMILSHTNRRRIMENITKVRPSITLGELLKISSRYSIDKKDNEEYGLTAIVGLFKRRGLVQRWMEALLSQTHPIKEIWFTYFASPIAQHLREEISDARAAYLNVSEQCKIKCTQRSCKLQYPLFKNNSCATTCLKQCKTLPEFIFFNMGEMQLKYFGRFQLALQCRTKYVVVLDDDCLPQNRYFEISMHTINTEQYRGILGAKGTTAAESLFFGPTSKTQHIIEADVVGGSWFMESEWVKLMFHDKMFSWNTGEDYHLCANARKYANIRSFVMPVDPKETSTHSFSKDYLTISFAGDTTRIVPGTWESRSYIIEQLWLRGDRLMHSYSISQPCLLIFAEKNIDAMFLLEHSKRQLKDLGGSVAFATSNMKNSDIDSIKLKKECRSFHDFMINRNYDTEGTPITSAAEVLYAFDMIIQGTQSTALMIAGSSSTTTMFALMTAALLRNIPVINIYDENDVVNLRRAEIIRAMSSVIITVSANRTLSTSNAQILDHYLTMLYK